MNTLQGPLFEPATTDNWKSQFAIDGAHYSIFRLSGKFSMDALRDLFKNGEADECNLCLFSISGVHGSYATIEQIEAALNRNNQEEDDIPVLTFLIIQPRIMCMRYANVEPKTPDDISFLKKLRQSSWDAVQKIGRD